jgi:hypothetical protein
MAARSEASRAAPPAGPRSAAKGQRVRPPYLLRSGRDQARCGGNAGEHVERLASPCTDLSGSRACVSGVSKLVGEKSA